MLTANAASLLYYFCSQCYNWNATGNTCVIQKKAFLQCAVWHCYTVHSFVVSCCVHLSVCHSLELYLGGWTYHQLPNLLRCSQCSSFLTPTITVCLLLTFLSTVDNWRFLCNSTASILCVTLLSYWWYCQSPMVLCIIVGLWIFLLCVSDAIYSVMPAGWPGVNYHVHFTFIVQFFAFWFCSLFVRTC